ncbi:MAG: AIM24 family protein [Acidimicrobiales bacterium]
MSDATTTYTCPYCRQTSTGATVSCPSCGAPVDIQLRTTSGGWTELPPIADMARIQAGQSQVEVTGRGVPVVDWALAAGDGVYFSHDVVLWKEPSVAMDSLPLKREWSRRRAGLPLVMLSAKGPGHIAFSHHTPGEVIALPLLPGGAVDVCEGRLLVATEGVDYDWLESNVWYVASDAPSSADVGAGAGLLDMGLRVAGMGDRRDRGDTNQSTFRYPLGQFLDRFTAGDRHGLVMIGAGGAAFTRTLAEGESLLVKPPALLFKEPTVAIQLHVEYPAAGMKLWRSWGNRYLWLRVWGPGRVGIESCYSPAEDPGTDFRDMSQATQHAW